MPGKNYTIHNYAVAKPSDEPHLTGPDYARIECACENGLKVVLHYQRPDADWPSDAASPVQNCVDPGTMEAHSYFPACEFAPHLRMFRSKRPIFAYIDTAYGSAFSLRLGDVVLHAIPPTGPLPLLEDWLQERAFISRRLIWRDATGEYLEYGEWPAALKQQLQEAFQKRLAGLPPQLGDPPPNILDSSETAAVVKIPPDAARDLYLAHVAHCLAVEIGGWVNWSLDDYDSDGGVEILTTLFNCSSIVGTRKPGDPPGDGFEVRGVMPAPPDVAFRFLRDNDLIQPDRFHTIAKVLDWCRDNLTHFDGGASRENMEAHWQYPIPPVSRIIEGTKSAAFPPMGFRHWTAGCHGTTHFLTALLRIVNIPVKYVAPAGHAGTFFMADNAYLCHGDDPYGRFSKATPAIPAERLLIDGDDFDRWFTQETDVRRRYANVGRRRRELAIWYLPDLLLHYRYLDIKEGTGISTDSLVYKSFTCSFGDETLYPISIDTLRSGSITTAEGHQIQCNLWGRLDAKIASFERAGPLMRLVQPQGIMERIWNKIKRVIRRLSG